MVSLMSTIRQLWPGTPTYTERDMPDLAGKVYLVTGSNTGIGQQVARILYSKNAAVWIASRSNEKGARAIASIKKAHPTSKGRLECLHLDLGDLATIKKAAEEFLAKENRLDVLFNNAGVMFPPQGSKTTQGYELQLGTNCLGPFLLTQFLTPILAKTAKTAPKSSVRVVWVSSSAAELMSPKHGVALDNLDYKHDMSAGHKYSVSKAGNYYHATEYARRNRDDGIVSVSLNPGNLKSELGRHSGFAVKLFRFIMTYPAANGAYTELFAGISSDVNMGNSGAWIVPWGRFGSIRKELVDGSKLEAEGGTGIARKFWEWSEAQTKPYS
ncbi:short-chain dehydrogenase [Xylaria intraflava]|nr:short-chain dehydrogenase [Xylaria intraflava]